MRVPDCGAAWGQSTEPGVTAITTTDPTIAEAIEEFTSYKSKTSTQGRTTEGKYEVFFQKRLLPWCQSRGIRFMREFDSPVTDRKFFESWVNLQPLRSKETKPGEVIKMLSARSMKVELERYRTFLRFCVSNQWIKTNYAVRDHLKVATPVSQARVQSISL